MTERRPKRKPLGILAGVTTPLVDRLYLSKTGSSGFPAEKPKNIGNSEQRSGLKSGAARANTSVPAQAVRNWKSLRSPTGCAV